MTVELQESNYPNTHFLQVNFPIYFTMFGIRTIKNYWEDGSKGTRNMLLGELIYLQKGVIWNTIKNIPFAPATLAQILGINKYA